MTGNLGFIGCGKIGSAVARGFALASQGDEECRMIFVSRRSEAKSVPLQTDFPSTVRILDDNQAIIDSSDTVFICLLPQYAEEQLPSLDFTGKTVISMMAAVKHQRVVELCRLEANRVFKICPLPSASRRVGPIPLYPPRRDVQELLNTVGNSVPCSSEEQMLPLISVAGHISSFYETYECIYINKTFAVSLSD